MLTISNKDILAIPISENKEALVDLRDYPEFAVHPDNTHLPRESLMLRKSVAEKLQLAQASLSEYKLMIVEGFRPIELQKRYFEEYYQELESKHPDWQHNQLYNEVSKYVSPPEIIPPHSTGGAVDLTLCTLDNVELDMGTKVNDTPAETKDAVFMNAKNISDDAVKNRQLLKDVLENVGLVNYPYEFWHWSYGDRYWAYKTKQEFALYGSV